ncbi:uncharacterized protein SPSC_01978 [Sporisorium scitamineum]|uniref:Uncharacterized protein n=1 Tax=Sporisorium scitamineum TaxID=49012 RepID=A0A0F7SBX2_9BASI|nr:uncharacterized protein SPSC_01978 [Sporisorium scitamineum]CDW98278.1 hypothetical protein [Sporisorium scitamineum]
MQLKRTWLALLGAVSLALISQVAADDPQITNPYLTVIRQFNIVLTDNTKVYDLACCMGVPNELATTQTRRCFEHQDLAMSHTPGARRMGLQYCHHLPGSTPDEATQRFKERCTLDGGEIITPDKSYCPQIWPNYDDKYVKPAPAPAPAPGGDGAPPPAPNPAPDAAGRSTNDKDGFKSEGTFHYTLVDYAITRSLACCKASSKPIVKPVSQPDKPKLCSCAQRKVASDTFMAQCAKILPTITKSKKLSGYTTIKGDGDAIVDDKTKEQCSAMWTNALSYTYGFCQLDNDSARDDAIKAFQYDCTSKGGEPKEPHNGMCLWNVDDAAADSTTA